MVHGFGIVRKAVLALGLGTCLVSARPTSAQLVYNSDFESGAGPEWSNTTTSTTPVGGRRFLGEFGQQAISLTLTGLPTHNCVTVSFDLFVIRSWDGSYNGWGPDIFDLSVAGGPTLLHATFSNVGSTQSYPDNFPSVEHPERTGAVENNTLGYSYYWGDSVYRLTYNFYHSDTALALNFTGLTTEDVSNEAWGLDNVQVNVSNGVDALPPTTTASVYGSCPVNVALTATDPDSCGPPVTYYTLDGGPIQTYSAPFQVTGNGSHTVEYWSVDPVGNEENPHNTTIVQITDVIPPTTTASLQGNAGNNGWWRSVVVSLIATDPDSCNITLNYSVDSGPINSPSGGNPVGAAFQIYGEGEHTVQYWSVDEAGNAEGPKSISVGIDTTPPLVTESVTLSKVKGTTIATVSGKITDTASGPDRSSVFYQVYDEYGKITPSGTVTVKPDGTYSFTVTLGQPAAGDKDGRRFELVVNAKDVAGNAGSRTVIVTVTNK